MSSEFEQQNGFENGVEYYLEAASRAHVMDKYRLAISLYRVAYELELELSNQTSEGVINGLRNAWNLACEHNDRSSAESIFAELSSFNTVEENEQSVLRLQSLALSSLEQMGISDADIETIAAAVSKELDESQTTDMQLAPTGLSKLREQLKEMQNRNQAITETPQINYQLLVGFDNALESMRQYGFSSAGDDSFKNFVEKSAAMHGVAPLSLGGSFLFYGHSREDVNIFAHATVSEIGAPVIHFMVDLDKQGNGSVRLAGPFKRSVMGAFDFMNMPTPCVVLIENIDLLQAMFDTEQNSLQDYNTQMKGVMGPSVRSMQVELMGYLRVLRQKQGVYMMATTQSLAPLKSEIREVLGQLYEVEVAAPNADERYDLLKAFAEEHPSFTEVNIDALVTFTKTMSRNDLMNACKTAVEAAYRESLRSGKFNKVQLADAYLSVAPYIDHTSELYQKIEDAVVKDLLRGIDEHL